MVVVVDVLLILREFMPVRRTLGLLHFACGIAEAKCIVVTAFCVFVCLFVPCRIPTLLHGPGCKLGELSGVPSSCARLGGFAVGALVLLL